MKHTVTLRNGVQVPALGLGTWFLGENKAARAREMESLRTGISAGMTLIDTAEMYGNGKAESLIKEVISDKKRDDLFLVSKVLPNNAGKHRLEQALDNSMKRMGVEYLDLYLYHWRKKQERSKNGAFPTLILMIWKNCGRSRKAETAW